MTINSIANSQMSNKMMQLSNGKRINSAADDAAGLAIAKKMETLISGINVGERNAGQSQDALRVADGGTSGISDQLSRIRELGVQASNGILTDSDRQLIQNEIEQIKEGIASAASGTQFNTKNLLDGSFTEINTATASDGSGMKMQVGDMTLDALGIKDFDVTSGVFDLGVIDNALEIVNTSRAEIGAQSNRLDSTTSYNQIASLNLHAAKSRIADTDFAQSISEYNRDKVLQNIRIGMQSKTMQAQGGFLSLMG